MEVEVEVVTVTMMMTNTKNAGPCQEMSTRCVPNPYILPTVSTALSATELLETRKAAVAWSAVQPRPIWRANTASDYMRVLKSRSLLAAVNVRRPDQSAAITDLKAAAASSC